jgi:hypothetical protein
MVVSKLSPRRKHVLEEIYRCMQGGIEHSYTIGHLTSNEQEIIKKIFGIKISKLDTGYYFLVFPKKEENPKNKVLMSPKVMSLSDEIEELFNKMPDETHPEYEKWRDDINNMVKYCNTLAGAEVYPLF